MGIFKSRISKKTKLQILLVAAVTVALLAAIVIDIITGGPVTSLLSNKAAVIATVKEWGFFAPLLYILLQIAQTIAAPIPGQVVGTVGGFLFGWWGILWTVIGSAIGFFIVFMFSRRFGRPLVEKVVKKEHLDKFDFVAGKHAPLILFLIFVIPGFPDDIVCYIAGLTEIPIKTLMAMIVVGRMPAVIATNIFGASLGEDNLAPVIAIVVATLVLVGIAVLYRRQITAYFKRLSREED